MAESDNISDQRKQQAQPVIDYLLKVISLGKEPKLLFVCTQNSRRSMFAQVWAQLGALIFGVKNFHVYSAGSESTALHPNTRDALIRTGIKIDELTGGENPLYRASFSGAFPSVDLFSKSIDFSENPKKDFGAVLVCVEDAEACPFIPNADVRIPLPYADPKKFDNSDEMEAAYDRCCQQIAAEMFWVMKTVSEKI
ncbi:MAG: protein-tyrosine-phosphatase [Chitinophagales bacterium]